MRMRTRRCELAFVREFRHTQEEVGMQMEMREGGCAGRGAGDG